MYKILFLNDDAKDGTSPTFLCFFVRNSRLLWSLCLCYGVFSQRTKNVMKIPILIFSRGSNKNKPTSGD